MHSSLDNAIPLVNDLADLLIANNWTITSAESCTGGLLAAAFTEVSGSSAWFRQSVVSYSNEAKVALLDVDESVIVQHGAVSRPVVEAMAIGALNKASSDVAVSISGIAGPEGGTVDKPVGTVWIGWAFGANVQQSTSDKRQTMQKIQSFSTVFEGDRASVRSAAIVEALRGTILRVTTQ